MASSGADIIDIDWMVDLGLAADIIGERAAVCGNVDPVAVMLQGTPEQVRKATLNCVKLGGGLSISAAGCEIPDGTPYDNLLAQKEALQQVGKEWGVKRPDATKKNKRIRSQDGNHPTSPRLGD